MLREKCSNWKTGNFFCFMVQPSSRKTFQSQFKIPEVASIDLPCLRYEPTWITFRTAFKPCISKIETCFLSLSYFLFAFCCLDSIRKSVCFFIEIVVSLTICRPFCNQKTICRCIDAVLLTVIISVFLSTKFTQR